MKKLKKNLFENGWSIVRCESLNHIKLISKNFLSELKKIKVANEKFKIKKINDIDGLRKCVNTLDIDTLNFIKKTYIKKISEKVIKAFSSVLIPIFGEKLFVQKYPHVQFHRGFCKSPIMIPHNEIMGGHSPFTYNIWLPLHDVFDNSGIYLINDKLSSKLCDIEINKKIKDRKKFLLKYHFFPKIKFGEALIFNSFVFHASVYHKNDHARISLDTRFQRSDRPLFEKYNEFFTRINL